MMTIFETINQWAEIWLSYMGNRMLDAAFVFAAVGFLWILVRKRVSVQFGYFLFLLVLIKSVLPAPIYLPSLTLGFIPKPTVVQKSEGTVVFWGFENKRQENREAVPTQEKREESAPIAGSQATHSQNLSFSGYAMLSWAILTGFFLIRLAISTIANCPPARRWSIFPNSITGSGMEEWMDFPPIHSRPITTIH